MGDYRLDTAQVFTLLFITLGPLKLLGPFAQATRRLAPGELRRLAFAATAIGLVALVGGGFLGSFLMEKWTLPQGALRLTAGIIFFRVALDAVLSPYDMAPAAAEATPAPASPGPMRIAFPMLVTPYGIAGVITLLATAQDAERIGATLAMLVLVMALNLAAMLFVRTIMRPSFVALLQVVGAVLGVLQVALAIAIILGALQLLGVMQTAS